MHLGNIFPVLLRIFMCAPIPSMISRLFWAFFFFVCLSYPVFASGVVAIREATAFNLLKLDNGEEIQLIGVDLPAVEDVQFTGQNDAARKKDQETLAAVYREAQDFLIQALELGAKTDHGISARWEFDTVRRSPEGRRFAYVFLRCPEENIRPWVFENNHSWLRPKKGHYELFLNAYLIRSGYAIPDTRAANKKYARLLEELFESAVEEERGLWAYGTGDCFKCKEKEEDHSGISRIDNNDSKD